MDKLIAVLGIAVFLGMAVLLSNNRRKINWRLVVTGIGIQLVLAFLILNVDLFRIAADGVGNGIQYLLAGAKEGLAFVLGEELAKQKFVFAFVIGASIIFVGGITNILYHLGVLQWVVRGLAFLLRKSMGVSGVEALSTGAEVFLGQVESQLLVKNYIKNVTPSELLGIMAAAMATISGSALVAYVGLGINPTYLLMASFMTAPSALVIAKIMVPETDMAALERDATIADDETPAANWVEAAAEGAWQGLKVAANVMVQLILFIGLVYLANGLLGAILGNFGIDWRIQDIVGFFFTPVAWLMGIPWDEAVRVGPLLGTKTVLNEFIAYMDLAKMSSGPGALSPVTVMVTTIALCGSANLGSIGINIGGLSKMAPERKSDIARMGFKALMAATIASWLTAAIARLVM